MTEFKPLNDYMVLEEVVEEQTASGLFLTNQEKQQTAVGTVVAIGPGRLLENGERYRLGANPGQRVLFRRYSGMEFKVDGKTFFAVREGDVMTVLSK